MRRLNTTWICWLTCMLFVYTLQAQDTYDIDDLVLAPKSELKKDFSESYAQLIAEIKQGPKCKKRKEFLADLEYFKSDFEKQIADGDVIRDNTIYPRVRMMLDNILRQNPSIQYRPHLYISRQNIANAYCLVDGSVIVTTGLIHFMQNEAQVASILCHELAHKLMNHSYQSIRYSLEEADSKKNKKLIKNLKKKKYNRSETALNHLRDKLYQDAERSRTHEYEADSLGFELFSHTDYPHNQFIEALALRAQYDTIQPIELDRTIYPQVFDKEGIDYDTSRLKMDDFSAYNYHDKEEKINRDSIRTHPEDSARMAAISTTFNVTLDSLAAKVPSDTLYNSLRWIARSHQVPSLIHHERFDHAIYLCLYRLQQSQNEDFHMRELRYLFKELHKARKTYKYNRYVENINPKTQDLDYQQLLNFLWNISLTDLQRISEHL